VRNSKIPILGFVQVINWKLWHMAIHMPIVQGWFDNTILDIETYVAPDSISIINNSPIFNNIPNPFFGVEIHSWATAEEVFPLIGFEVLAQSSYVQATKN